MASSIATVVGVGLGVAAGWFADVEAALESFIWFKYSSPTIAFYPLFVAWLGYGRPTIVAIGALFALTPIYANTLSGIKNVDSEVGVGVGDSERSQRKVLQPLQHLAAVIAQILELVAGMVGQPGAVRVQVADGHVSVTWGRTARTTAAWSITGVSQVDRAFGDLVGDDGRTDRFGHRSQLEDGVGVHLVVRAIWFATSLTPKPLA